MPHPALLQDRDGKTVDANQAAADVLGLSPKRLRARASSPLDGPARHTDGRPFRSEERPGRRAILSGVPQTDVTMVFGHPGDTATWLEVSAMPIGSIEDDGPVLLTMFRDVTEQRAHDEEISVQASLLAAVGDAIIATDEDIRITYWNAAAERIYGYTSEEAMGQSI